MVKHAAFFILMMLTKPLKYMAINFQPYPIPQPIQIFQKQPELFWCYNDFHCFGIFFERLFPKISHSSPLNPHFDI